MNINEIPPKSRVWIYQSHRVFSNAEADEISRAANHFIDEWTAHGKNMSASFKVLHNCFLILFADEEATKASGCSIDSSVNFIKQIEKHFELNLFERTNIAYRSAEGKVKVTSFNKFTNLLEQGALNEDTVIFNNLIHTKEELQTKWEVPVKDSWVMQRI